MGYARKSIISLNDTPYYPVVARCVRRAWLWGFDGYAGKDYSHRKSWVLERLQLLGKLFAVDLCAYAIMSNHYHLVGQADDSIMREEIRRITLDQARKLRSLSNAKKCQEMTEDDIDKIIAEDPDLYQLTDAELAQFEIARVSAQLTTFSNAYAPTIIR